MNRLKKRREKKENSPVPATKPAPAPEYAAVCEVYRGDLEPLGFMKSPQGKLMVVSSTESHQGKLITFAVSRGTSKHSPEACAKPRALWRLKKRLRRRWKQGEFKVRLRRI